VVERAFIPIQASQFDVWTLSRVNELVKTARAFNAGLRAFIVLSRISPKRAEAEEAIRDFEHLELSQSVIRDRIAYRKAARARSTAPRAPHLTRPHQASWPVRDRSLGHSCACSISSRHR
jgi:cellulose biosynthesis protein BcsQ